MVSLQLLKFFAIFGRKYKELGDRKNLSKINILYASVNNTHQAKNGLKKEKSSVLYAAIYGKYYYYIKHPDSNHRVSAAFGLANLRPFKTF